MKTKILIALATPILILVLMRALLGGFRADEMHRVTYATDDPIREHELARTSVVIDVPVEFLWKMLSDNSHAHDWSAFFDRILDLPANPSDQSDIGVGARRRSFRNLEDVGFYWDEESVAVIPNRFKRIYVFNIRNDTWFKQLLWNDTESYTDNIYESLGPEKTRFTFSTFVHGFNGPFWNVVYEALGQTTLLKELFMLNQDNIKLLAEALYTETKYQRLHPYDPKYYKGDLDKKIPPLDQVETPKLSASDHKDMMQTHPPLY